MAEIDEPENTSNWRKMILAARRQTGAEELLAEDCEDEEEWITEIEELSYLILWDADYNDEDMYIDKAPDKAHQLKDFMQIQDEYYLEIPDDLTSKEIETQLSRLKALCRSICEKFSD